MTDPGVPDLTDQQVRTDVIARKLPRQVAGLYLYQWWAARQTDKRLIRWVRQQIIQEMFANDPKAAEEFLKALVGR